MTELYNYRNVLKSLIVKNLVGRYKNSILGFSWHFIFPLMLLFTYYIVFTQIRTSPIANFWIFLSSALFPLNYMISNLTVGAGCIVNNAGMIKKMYFPREIIILSQILSSFIILLFSYSVVLLAMILSGYGLGISLLFVPIMFIVMLGFTTGYTLIFSALTVYIRDVQHILSSVSLAIYFLTPIYFMSDGVGGLLGTLIWFNPYTYYVEAFHQIVYFGSFPEIYHILICTLLSVTSLLLGLIVFNKLKRGFVERL